MLDKEDILATTKQLRFLETLKQDLIEKGLQEKKLNKLMNYYKNNDGSFDRVNASALIDKFLRWKNTSLENAQDELEAELRDIEFRQKYEPFFKEEEQKEFRIVSVKCKVCGNEAELLLLENQNVKEIYVCSCGSREVEISE